MFKAISAARAARKAGVIGINERNVNFISGLNQRRYYPLVDNKLRSKELALSVNISVPKLYAVIKTQHDIAKLSTILSALSDFVIKPVAGSGGKGILVIADQRHGMFVKSSGATIKLEHVEHYVSNIISGLYSLGGKTDQAMIEYRVKVVPLFDKLTVGGVPDIRAIVVKGVPVMAMMRVPTLESDGKANLHQGAIGVGIDIVTGVCNSLVYHNRVIERHPDTLASIKGLQIPQWKEVLRLSASCYDITRLGYMGVDFVFDRDYGPMMLEMNARPGLSIQIANREGLKPRLKKVLSLANIPESVEQRVELSGELFRQTS